MNAAALLYLVSVGGLTLVRRRPWILVLVALQSAAAAAALLLGGSLHGLASFIALADLLLLRMLLLPWVLGRELRKVDGASAEPTPLARWSTALAMVSLIGAALAMGHRLEPGDSLRAHLLGAAVSGVLGGMLLLTVSREPSRQIIALLTFESGIVLCERLASHGHEGYLQPLFTLLFVWSIALYRLFLRRLGTEGEPLGPHLSEIAEGEVL